MGDYAIYLPRTDALSTTVTTNAYDAADELTSASRASDVGPGEPTTYTYDVAGNQVGSTGQTGTITNTYDLRNELVAIIGPTTNLTFVYDGQGDRLRSYDASSGTPTLSNYAQDLAAGMSDLVSDGSADYAYLNPGSGQAPLAGYTLSTQRTTTLGTDLLGSVRLVTDPTGATIGAGAYDAWGNERPNPDTSTGSGATLLAGLQGSQPFGYAGQYYDAAAGSYDMRAREYSPQQGQFESVDPLLDQTGQPYEYAGDDPVGTTDPSGLLSDPATVGYYMAWPSDPNNYNLVKDAIIYDYIKGDPAHLTYSHAANSGSAAGSADLVSFSAFPTLENGLIGEVYDVVPDYFAQPGNNGDPTHARGGAFGPNAACGPVVNEPEYLSCQYVQSLSSLQNLTASPSGLTYRDNAWQLHTPDMDAKKCSDTPPALLLGRSYPDSFTSALTWSLQGPTFNSAMAKASNRTIHGSAVHIFSRLLAPGLIGFSVCTLGKSTDGYFTVTDTPCAQPSRNLAPNTPSCAFGGAAAGLCVLDVFLGNALSDYVRCPSGGEGNQCRAAAESNAFFGIVLSSVGGVGELAPELEDFDAVGLPNGIRSVEQLRTALATESSAGEGSQSAVAVVEDGEIRVATEAEAKELPADVVACPRCFPADTLVATVGGSVTISNLRPGNRVLAEDPTTGLVRVERVEALIARPVSPLLALTLSDGSSLVVQPDHPFWVDGGPGIDGPGWYTAGTLRVGDRLRTAAGRDVSVVAIRWNAGDANVYTLTVANDHTFFVGSARVLVHNTDVDAETLACSLYYAGIKRPRSGDYSPHHIVPTGAFSGRNLEAQRALERSQEILREAGIDLNDAPNGVWLEQDYHLGVHTNDYLENVANALEKAVDPKTHDVDVAKVKSILSEIAVRLQARDPSLY